MKLVFLLMSMAPGLLFPRRSTHLLASLEDWQMARILSINGPEISKAFLMLSVSGRRIALIPVMGILPSNLNADIRWLTLRINRFW